jgi:hypothetical protein
MFKFYLIGFACLAYLNACGTGKTREDEVPYHPAAETASIEAKMAAAQSESSDVAEVKFTQGETGLEKSEIQKLKDGLTQAQKKHKINRVTVAVWSDSEMPDDGDLPDPEVSLAKERGQKLRTQLKTFDSNLRVKVINMAEKPGAIKTFLKSESVRIRDTLESTGHANAKASRAIVIFRSRSKE